MENKYGVQLMRWAGPFGKKSPDWFDANGTTYDAYGPFDPRYFKTNWDNGKTKASLKAHAEKADIVPVDITGLDAGQVSLLKDYIKQFEPGMFLIIP